MITVSKKITITCSRIIEDPGSMNYITPQIGGKEGGVPLNSYTHRRLLLYFFSSPSSGLGMGENILSLSSSSYFAEQFCPCTCQLLRFPPFLVREATPVCVEGRMIRGKL
ncbi:hypothetical protein CDAR_366571 [Caerostris darwini]|uniref:Uncharacterized protein n=1 Tax=Caerostris darwini TaxID=1538125 RepID=A0AAV4Q2U2_9ARAC|nr:hypothetical protein CDAR_366571 [Caerostris darwini]